MYYYVCGANNKQQMCLRLWWIQQGPPANEKNQGETETQSGIWSRPPANEKNRGDTETQSGIWTLRDSREGYVYMSNIHIYIYICICTAQ